MGRSVSGLNANGKIVSTVVEITLRHHLCIIHQLTTTITCQHAVKHFRNIFIAAIYITPEPGAKAPWSETQWPGLDAGTTDGYTLGWHRPYNKKGSPYSITECRVTQLIPVLGSQPAGDVNHKPGSRLPLLSTRSAVTPASIKRVATNFAAW